MIRKILKIIFVILALILLVSIVALSVEQRKTTDILDDYKDIYSDEKYEEAIMLEGVSLVRQEYSCGYAIIEMVSTFVGNGVSEEELFDDYGKVVTSTGESFCTEMNKRLPQYKTTMFKYLKNTELIDKVYSSLKKGMPVPFEWAAKRDGKWTLHYSLVFGLDIKADTVYVLNPYGYMEALSLEEFFSRTSFVAYSDMPIYLELAFSLGIFERNTIFIIDFD